MVELEVRHTASNLSTVIGEILNEYGISILQLITITTDNAKNIVGAGNNLKSRQQGEMVNSALREYERKLRYSRENIPDDDDEALNEWYNDEEDFDDLNEDVPDNVRSALKAMNVNLEVVRCAIHTEQLGVKDAMKIIEPKNKDLFKKLQSAVKAMKGSTYIELVKKYNLKIPPLFATPRWNTQYNFSCALENIKDKWNKICESLSGKDLEAVQIDDNSWTFLSNFNAVFKQPYVLTMKLQSQSISMCKFFLKRIYKISNN